MAARVNGRKVPVKHRPQSPPDTGTFSGLLGARIRSLREVKNLTQQELNYRSMNRLSSLSCWERGEAVPNLAGFLILAATLGVSPVELVPPEVQELAESGDVERLIAALDAGK